NLLSLDETRKDVIYARVSTHKQKNRGDLERQINNLKIYASDLNPIDLEVISDVASGLNDNRKGLLKLINLIQEGKINRVFISYKDRLTRFGFNYIKQICDFNNTEIVIVSNDIENKAVELELAEDIISLIHSFSGKLYGLRSKVKLEIDKELSSDEGTTS
ncbi:MAG: IS607 family transposase, partial [Erysipelotrichia bacterium]|nr:IS607 family transposase [Erysipelotrichia bacterium]